jgi:hypothetical protein
VTPCGDIEDDMIVDLVTDLVLPLSKFILEESDLTAHDAELGIIYVLSTR